MRSSVSPPDRHEPVPVGPFWRQLAEQYGHTLTLPAASPRLARRSARIGQSDPPTTTEVAQLSLDLSNPQEATSCTPA